MKNNKIIGIIGGIGPQATQLIYERIIYYAQNKYGAKNNDDFPHLMIESIPIPDFISDKKKINVAEKMLIKSTERFTNAGVSYIAIASNTVHILLTTLQYITSIPFISIIDLVAKQCHKLKYKKVGLLGSPMLIGSGLYTKELRKYGITLELPTSDEIRISEKIIRHVLAGTTNELDKIQYINMFSDFYSRGCETIILGCTELPLAINYEALGNKTINSDDTLAETITDYYYC